MGNRIGGPSYFGVLVGGQNEQIVIALSKRSTVASVKYCVILSQSYLPAHL